MTPSSRERKYPARQRSITMNRERLSKNSPKSRQSSQGRRGNDMRVRETFGRMVIVGTLAASGTARAQEMQMPAQERHHQMNIPVVKPENPRLGRSQEDAKGALVTLEQVEKTAGESNPTLRQAEAEILAAKARQQQTGLYPNPTVAYTGDEIHVGSVGGGERGDIV